jgi:hypothetical protein
MLGNIFPTPELVPDTYRYRLFTVQQAITPLMCVIYTGLTLGHSCYHNLTVTGLYIGAYGSVTNKPEHE